MGRYSDNYADVNSENWLKLLTFLVKNETSVIEELNNDGRILSGVKLSDWTKCVWDDTFH